jgi:hypothetical protein
VLLVLMVAGGGEHGPGQHSGGLPDQSRQSSATVRA